MQRAKITYWKGEPHATLQQFIKNTWVDVRELTVSKGTDGQINVNYGGSFDLVVKGTTELMKLPEPLELLEDEG